MKSRIYYILSVQIFISSIGYAQKQITHQQLYWIRYYGQYVLSPNWTATLEVEDRRYFQHNRQLYWVLPRINVLYNLGSGWQAAAGFTYYLTTNPADPEKSASVTVPELRPHQELDYRQNISTLTIDHRYRLEERWIHHYAGSKLTPGYSFNFRFRYQLQLSYPIINKSKPAGRLTAKLADEILLNFGRQIVYNAFDQNRIYAGLNYGISPNVQLELGYLNWFQQRSSGNQYYNRDNIRLTFYHRLKF